MAIGTYTELTTAIYAWMLRSNTDIVVTSGQIENYVALLEAELNRELRIRELEETAAVVTAADTDYAALPSDFKKLNTLEFDSVPFDIEYVTRRKLKELYGGQTGRPKAYTIYANRIYFGPTPDAVYNMTIDYYKAIDPLTSGDPTNEILTPYPDIYLYGALKHGYMQLKDTENANAVGQNYNAIIERVKQADVESRLPNKLIMKARNPIG